MPALSDSFAGAPTLAGSSGTQTFDLSAATLEAGEPASLYAPDYDFGSGLLNASLWAKFTPVADCFITVRLANGSHCDLVLESFHGTAIGALTGLNISDWGSWRPDPDGNEVLSIAATGGETYYVRVSAFDYDVGRTGTLLWDVVADGFANTSYATATDLAPYGGSHTPLAIGGAAGVPIAPFPQPISWDATEWLWFRYVAPADGTVHFTTDGSPFTAYTGGMDTKMEVYAADHTTLLASNDDGGGSLVGGQPNNSYVSLAVVGGQTYYVRLYVWNLAAGEGDLHFAWGGISAPVWVDNTILHAKVAYLGAYLGSDWPPHPPGLAEDWPDDAQEIDFVVTGLKTDSSVIAASALKFSNNANGSGGYVPTGYGYVYWNDAIEDSVAERYADVRNVADAVTPPTSPQVYVIWYGPNWDWPMSAPSLDPLDIASTDQVAGGTRAYTPPDNDHYTDRTVIVGDSGSIDIDCRDAWMDLGEVWGNYQNGASGVWLEWVAPADGLVAFTSTLDAPHPDDWGSDLLVTVFSEDDVGTGPTPGYDGADLSSSGNGPNPYTLCTFTAESGKTYYLWIENGDALVGTFTWAYPTPPTNDNFADRIVLAGDTGDETFNLAYATEEAGEPTYFGTGHTAWWEWTPAADIDIRWSVDRFQGQARHYLRVYTATGVIPVDDDIVMITNAAGTNHFAAVGGTTYIVRAELVTAGYGFTDLHWLPYVPLDDNFTPATAIPLTGNTGVADFDGSDGQSHGHYFALTPDDDITVTVWADQHYEPNFFSPDDRFATLHLAANDTMVPEQGHWYFDAGGFYSHAFELRGGTTYWVRVVQFNGYAGRLHWDASLPQANNFADAPLLTDRVMYQPLLAGAALEAGETSPGIGTTSWLRWLCPADGDYVLAVREPGWYPAGGGLGSGPSRGRIARLGTATTVADFAELAIATSTLADADPDDPSVQNRQTTVFTADGGTTYYVQLDAAEASGVVLGCVVIYPHADPPANDEPAGAVDLAGDTGSVGPIDVAGSTAVSIYDPYFNGYSADPDNPLGTSSSWYRFVGPADVDADTQGSTLFTVTDAVRGEITGWRIFIERFPDTYPITTDTGMGQLILVGSYGDRTKFRPVAGQVYWLALSERNGRAVTISWEPGTYYHRGDWIDDRAADYSTYEPAAVFGSGGNSWRGSWEQDQSFYNYHFGMFAYTTPFARQCAFDHARIGDVGGFSEYANDVAGFDTICYALTAPNPANDPWLRTGLDEGWDEGGFLTSAFYNLAIMQAHWLLDFYYALYGPPAPPSPPAGSITQVEGVRHYSDQGSGVSWIFEGSGEIAHYQLLDFDLEGESYAGRADTGWTWELRDAGTGVTTFIQPGDESGYPLVHSETLSGTAGVELDVVTFSEHIAAPDPFLWTYYGDPHPALAYVATSDVGRASGPPAAVRTLSDHQQRQSIYFSLYARNVHRKPPRYRVLTPIGLSGWKLGPLAMD